MESVNDALRRVKRKLRFITLVDALLSGIIVALAFLIIAAFFSLPWSIPVAAGTIAFIAIFVRSVRRIRIQEAEKRIPKMEWQLRTAEDTANKRNEVIEALHRDVMENVRLIRTSALFDRKNLLRRFGAIAVLAALLVAIPTAHLTAQDVKEGVITGFASLATGRGFWGGNAEGKENASDADIYGRPDKLKEGLYEVGVEVQKSESDLNLDELRDPRELTFNREERATSSGAVADASYNEKINSNRDLVDRYFKNLAEE